MLKVGLTGGIAAGKSTVAGILASFGAVILDADVLAREVLAPGTPGWEAVVAEFGPQVVTPDGKLDRPAMARVVFADDMKRRVLEQITHPLIALRTQEFLRSVQPDAIVVHDVPLLIERGMGPQYHLVVVVSAPEAVRIDRLVKYRGMTTADARLRMSAQVSDAQRRCAADEWIDADQDLAQLTTTLGSLWNQRLVPFERNLRDGASVSPPGRPEIVDYDPTWPLTAARLIDRIGAAVGSLGRVVEHIGSTAVPGLASKNVIDLQLGVDSMHDADAAAEMLSRAGFPIFPGVISDTVHPMLGSCQEQWVKRFHRGADPAVFVNLHVRVIDGPGWRTAMLLRQWWRSVPAERHAYEQFKRELAGRSSSFLDYQTAKQPWIEGAIGRALKWQRGD